jgi:uracil-DNA glycosylase family 4
MNGSLFGQTNPKCEGCPILKKPLPRHSILEDIYEEPCDILFVSDSPKMFEGEYVAFRIQEYAVIMKELSKYDLGDLKIGFTYAAKCPNMNMDVMGAKARKQCRGHLMDAIEHYKPGLVFSCGKLATNMFFKRAKDAGKIRGRLQTMTMDEENEDSHEFQFVSIIHPWQVVSEPKNEYLFAKDIENTVNELILKKNNRKLVPYDPILSIEDLKKFGWGFACTTKPVSVDTETTGFNFQKDYMHSIAFTELDPNTWEPIRTIALPMDHKDFEGSPYVKEQFKLFIIAVLRNPENRKIFQNAIFDLRFLAMNGITNIPNIWDTKLMAHMWNEEVPKSLSDLVYYFYNEEM